MGGILHLRDRVVKEAKFLWTLLTGASEPQRGVQQVLWRQTGENSAQRFLLTSTPSWEAVFMPTAASGGWVLRLRLQESDPKMRTGVACLEVTLRVLVQHAERAQGKAWVCQRGKRSSPLGPSNSKCSQITGLCLCECHKVGWAGCGLWPQRWACPGTYCHQRWQECQRRWGMAWGYGLRHQRWLWRLPQWLPSCEWEQVTVHNFLEDCVAWFFQGTQGQFAWESTSDSSSFQQVSTATGTASLCLPYLFYSLAWLSKWARGLIRPLLSVAYTQSGGQNQSGTPGAVWPKKRKGIHSGRSGCSTLNPCNWLKTVSFGGNCGLWKQVRVGVRPDLSRSWSHITNIRSRDLLRTLQPAERRPQTQ